MCTIFLYLPLFKNAPIKYVLSYTFLIYLCIIYLDATYLLHMLSSMRIILWFFSRFTVFLYEPLFLRWYPCCICQNPVLPYFLRAIPRAVSECGGGGGWGYHGWPGGFPGLVRDFNQVGVLTCQTNSQFRIPFQIHVL